MLNHERKTTMSQSNRKYDWTAGRAYDWETQFCRQYSAHKYDSELEGEWELWFAWFPVQLLTLQWAWFRFVHRRPVNYGQYDYCN